MDRRAKCWVAAVVVIAATGLACSRKPKEKEYVVLGEYVNPQDSLPRLRYFDGGVVSLNDRCAVRKVKLNPKMPPVYVNGRAIGFC